MENILIHHPLCPFSRQIRWILNELNIVTEKKQIEFWNYTEEFLKLSPSGELPIFITKDNNNIIGAYSILEYINETYKNSFFSENAYINSEIRRLISWSNNKLYREVTKIFVDEKIIKAKLLNESPDTQNLRIAKENIYYHINYLENIINIKSQIADEKITFADFILASHFSLIDYLNEFPWEKSSIIKNWYLLLKSRPSFQDILRDNVPGINPPEHYLELDF